MRTFHCDHCGQPIFFENVQCLRCGSALAFLPQRLAMCAVEPAPGGTGLWQRRERRGASPRLYRMCFNHGKYHACNFAVPQDDPNPLCVSCRETRVLPDLSIPDNIGRWYRIEVAKRRLFYTLARLGLVSVNPPNGAHDGPVFEFLADTPGQPVLTGHANGVITLNIAEADDTERVRRRVALHEPYRTLLGHLRHESGHFYWDRLVAEGGRTGRFRAVFGDESRDYGEALQQYYATGGGGGVTGWEANHVSAYATSHPWEDWAETWAHYLHMVDLLETGASYNTRFAMSPQEPLEEVIDPFAAGDDFDTMVADWVPLTLLVNSLNRSLGQEDAYPFALSPGAVEKLRFVHDVIRESRHPNAEFAEGSQSPQSNKEKNSAPSA